MVEPCMMLHSRGTVLPPFLLDVVAVGVRLHARSPRLDVVRDQILGAEPAELVIEEMRVTEMYPPLTFIVFERDCREIPEPYIRIVGPEQTGRFTEEL
jgi:hypothetical protein